MTDASGVKVKGYKSLVRSMKEIGVPAKEINAAGKRAADAVLRESLTLVPVRSGKLRNTIRLSATARGISILAGNNSVTYANPIHWGWYKRHIAPQPFFAKALGYTRQEIYDNYFMQLESLITAEMSKQNADQS